MGIEIDNRMIEAVWRKLPSEVQESCGMGQVVEWLRPALEIVEQDYRLMKLCPESLTSDLRCALAEHHAADHGGVTPRGSKVTWS